MSSYEEAKASTELFGKSLEGLREIINEVIIRPLAQKAAAFIVKNFLAGDYAALGLVQYRFPRSKKARIRKKWSRRIENWRPAR